MKRLGEATGKLRDGQGRLILGNPRQGCIYCGAVAQKESANGKAILYQPAVECCPTTVSLQIRYRRDELSAIQGKLAEREEDLRRLEEEAQNAKPYEEARVARRAENARGSLHEFTLVVQRNIRELLGEIGRLERLLKDMEAG